HRQLIGVNLELRLERLLVRRRNTSELLDLFRSSLGIQSFGIAPLTNFEGRIHIDFDELARRQNSSYEVPVSAIRRDERRNADHPRLGEELGHLPNAANVFCPVFRRKTKVRTEPVPDVVTVQHVHVPSKIEQLPLQ